MSLQSTTTTMERSNVQIQTAPLGGVMVQTHIGSTTTTSSSSIEANNMHKYADTTSCSSSSSSSSSSTLKRSVTMPVPVVPAPLPQCTNKPITNLKHQRGKGTDRECREDDDNDSSSTNNSDNNESSNKNNNILHAQNQMLHEVKQTSSDDTHKTMKRSDVTNVKPPSSSSSSSSSSPDEPKHNHSPLQSQPQPQPTPCTKDNHKQNTLTQIVHCLTNYQINDALDEDEIVPAMIKMNDASKRRRQHRKWLMRDYSKGDTIDCHGMDGEEEEYWNDNDILQTEGGKNSNHDQLQQKQQQQQQQNRQEEYYNQLALDAIINVVDEDFFSNVIHETEQSSKQIMDDKTLKTYKDCLAIGAKGKFRKRKDMIVPIQIQEDHPKRRRRHSIMTSSETDRTTKTEVEKKRRRTKRKSKESHIVETEVDDGDNDDDDDILGLTALISAMIEIEEEEGRSVGTEFDGFLHQSRRLRVRKGHAKDNTRKQCLVPKKTNVNIVHAEPKRKKKVIVDNGVSPSPLSPQDGHLKEEDILLCAVLPAVQSNRRRSARRPVETKTVHVNAIVVDGKPFVLEEEEMEDFPKKRAYKKRQPYVKRGPYKKRKKTADLNNATNEATNDSDPGAEENKTKTQVRNKKRKSKETKEVPKKKPNDSIDCSPVSLTLLDWRRRQQWGENRDKKKNDKSSNLASDDVVMRSLSSAYPPGIDTTTVSWETMHNISEQDPNQPPTMEPPRKRHSNGTYGRLCSSILNCLQGKGRVFARHEFFYSDIDKAWFNENTYEMDLWKLGISSDTKLTRSEWGMIRRKIRNRPRLFSKKFIEGQMIELESYRQIVRKVQNGGKENMEVEDFGFEVLAALKVGTTVTAYHSRARLIHRGTVLAHNQKAALYLIQFERKELGWDWVKDTEVASHGIPEVLLSKRNPEALLNSKKCIPKHGSLPCGTTFSPLIDFYKREPQFASKKMTKFASKLKNGDHPKTMSCNPDSINIVAEREVLAKLINIIDSNLERKQLILDAIDECHNQLERNAGSFCMQKEDFKNHYDWLQDNLTQTNEALEAALVFQQVMYGKIYTGTQMIPENRNGTPSLTIPDLCRGKKWGLTQRRCAKEIGSELVKRAMKNTLMPKQDGNNNTRDEFLLNTVTSAVGIILTADLLSEIKHEYGNGHKNYFGPMRQSLSLLKPVEFPQLPEELNEVVDTRESALDDLKESLKMLQSELTTSIDISSTYNNSEC